MTRDDVHRERHIAHIVGTKPPEDKDLAVQRLRNIKDGTVKIPMTCGWCLSASVVNHPDIPVALDCLSCGKATFLTTAHEERKRRIKVYVETGLS